MKIEAPKDIQALVERMLFDWLVDGDSNGLRALNVVAVLPHLASERTVYRLLKAVLIRAPYGYRVRAARILCRLKDPLGITHLVYNSLRFHPLLNEDHSKVSGWHDHTAPFGRSLDDELTALLFQDITAGGLPHAYTLSQVRRDSTKALLIPLLLIDGPSSRHAAFILGLMGEAAALSTLVEWANSDPYPRDAIIALSHIDAAAARDTLRDFANMKNADHVYAIARDEIRNEASHRLSLLVGERTCGDVIRTYARMLVEWVDVVSASGEPSRIKLEQPIRALVCEPNTLAPAAANLIHEFANEEERRRLAAEQRYAVSDILRQITDLAVLQGCGFCPFVARPEPMVQELLRFNSLEISGFRVTYEADDYLRAATAWIEQPLEHLRMSRLSAHIMQQGNNVGQRAGR